MSKVSHQVPNYDESEYNSFVKEAQKIFGGQINRDWLVWAGDLMAEVRKLVEEDDAALKEQQAAAEKARVEDNEKKLAAWLDATLGGLTDDEVLQFQASLENDKKKNEEGEGETTQGLVEVDDTAKGDDETVKGDDEREGNATKSDGEEDVDNEPASRNTRKRVGAKKMVVEIRTGVRRKREEAVEPLKIKVSFVFLSVLFSLTLL